VPLSKILLVTSFLRHTQKFYKMRLFLNHAYCDAR